MSNGVVGDELQLAGLPVVDGSHRTTPSVVKAAALSEHTRTCSQLSQVNRPGKSWRLFGLCHASAVVA